MVITKKLSAGIAAISAVVILSGTSAYAALSDSTLFQQVISAGTLSTFIGDAAGVEVAAPSVVFPAQTVSNSVQTSVGTYGTDSQRIYVDNPGAVTGTGTWTLSLAATGGPTATWSGTSGTYPFNAASSTLGQLTINPSVGTLTATVGTTTGITKGSAATFSGGTNGPVTLLNASSSADDINRVYLTGVSASQTIPASQPAGTYTIDFTQTVAAV
jgi:hypothetical protein